MMTRIALSTLLALIAISTAAAQEWSVTDESYLKSFQKHLDSLRAAALRDDMAGARDDLKRLDWYVERWTQNKLLDHPKVKPLLPRYAACQEIIRTGKVPLVRRVHYIRRAGGKARKGGTRERPAKYLWRQLKAAEPGHELHISGPFHGWQGDGKLKVETPRLTWRGGFAPDWSTRDPVAHPTVFARRADSKASSNTRLMLELPSAAGWVLDGIVFDARRLNVYRSNGDLDAGRSAGYPILSATFSGTLVIRNCVFVNASRGAIRLTSVNGGLARIENCLFINCAGSGVDLQGTKDTRYVVQRCTFALIEGISSSPGRAINVGSQPTVEVRDNLFAYADYGVASLLSNARLTLVGNATHRLQAFYAFSAQSRTATADIGEALDEVEVDGEIDGNVRVDPDLQLDPTALLRYLSSTSRRGLDADARARELARATRRLGGATPPKPTDTQPTPRDDPPPKDPFAGEDDPFKQPPPKDPPRKDPKAGAPVVERRWYCPAYPAGAAWAFPASDACKAGARAPKVER